jgi:uncharacterized alkaline shock family protein YloU
LSEQSQQRTDSPLVSERGRTIIADSVVSQVAGMAAQEVDGVHMGGSASRAAGGIIGTITGSEGQTRGVSVSVGTTEVAIDLTMGVEYGRDIMEVVEEVRRRISERVQSFTGLRVTEMNATVSDIVFPEDGGPRRTLRSGTSSSTEVSGRSQTRTGGEPPQEAETAELRPEDVSRMRRPAGDDETTRRIERPEER